MKTTGKYDALVADALAKRQPVARIMRQAGFSEAEIRSCQSMLSEIKNRIVPEDDTTWKSRKRLCYMTRRRVVMERLESGKSRSEAGDVQLVEAYDRALACLGKPETQSSMSSMSQGLIVDL